MVDPSAQSTDMPEQRPAPCSGCDAQRLTPLACGSCGELSEPATRPSPFQLFGFAPTWTICPAELRKRLMKITRLTHPDLHAASPAAAALAERHTAELNHAYRVLLDDVQRAEWLIENAGGPPASSGVPQSLLMEVMEWNETLEELEGAPSPARLSGLIEELRQRRHAVMSELRSALSPLPEPGDVRLQTARGLVDQLRYLDRILGRCTALQPAAPRA
ncbi:MAG: iron-sulfur cluster co-chaperone HscB C-terminal domain-containing protein [Planctomycetota bacterium]